MGTWVHPIRRFSYDDGTPTPPCPMCGNPRARKNIGYPGEGLHLYCGTAGCESAVRLCQRAGCGKSFDLGPGARKYCPEHTPKVGAK